MKYVLFLAALLLGSVGYAQVNRFEDDEEQTKPKAETTQQPQLQNKPAANQLSFWDRTRFGGNFGASFYGGITYVNLSPRMYYMATEKLWLGTGLTFIWTNYKNYPPPYDNQFVYGLNLSAQYFPFGPIFLQAEYEPLNFESYLVDSQGYIVGETNQWTHALFLGGGISQPMGRGRFFISALYNVFWQDANRSYYSSPWVFRIGFGI
jgi:hypothetical protein